MSSRLKANPDVVFERVGDEMVLVHLSSNQIYELNRTAARFWELLATNLDLDQIKATMRDEFDVASDELDQEVSTFLERAQADRVILAEDQG